MEEKTKQELYKEFLNGNKHSFEKIVVMYKDKLIYFINKYVRDIDIAEDIAQDVFVYILIHKVNYDFKYSLKTYLFTIAKSKSINYLKRSKKIIYSDELEIAEQEELEEKVFQNEKAKNLIKSISKLKLDYQNAIYFADLEGLTYKEIGEIMKKNNSQIKVLIYRARKSLEKVLREEMEKYEG